jgi:hypothetical protein
MKRSRSFAWGGPASRVSVTLTGTEKRRVPAEKSLRSRRAFPLETLCRDMRDATTRGAPWNGEVTEATFAR